MEQSSHPQSWGCNAVMPVLKSGSGLSPWLIAMKSFLKGHPTVKASLPAFGALAILSATGEHSAVVVPLLATGGISGALAILYQSPESSGWAASPICHLKELWSSDCSVCHLRGPWSGYLFICHWSKCLPVERANQCMPLCLPVEGEVVTKLEFQTQ